MKKKTTKHTVEIPMENHADVIKDTRLNRINGEGPQTIVEFYQEVIKTNYKKHLRHGK